jgi:hypothetical protein
MEHSRGAGAFLPMVVKEHGRLFGSASAKIQMVMPGESRLGEEITGSLNRSMQRCIPF